MGLKVSEVRSVQSDKPLDTVVAVSPAPGTKVAVGSTVTLQVSTGAVAVPKVIGDNEDQARYALTQAGFKVSVVERESPAPAGTVINQDPAGGQLAQKGTTVTIVVARQPQQQPPSPSPSPQPR